MSRIIKFRGKCEPGYNYSDKTRWIYGSLIYKDKCFGICKEEDIEMGACCDDGISVIKDWSYIPVIPETVGQFTGQLDGNGKEIYERDILQSFDHGQIKQLYVVVYLEGCFWAVLDNKPKECTAYWLPFHRVNFESAEVIGNIHDNPDLLTIKYKRLC
jgi:uncharacterized phage protein (TIGR01671 family)